MTLSIRPARRTEAKPLVGLYAESGKGKTKSALLLARGFVGAKGKIAMIETESGRGEVYADDAEILGYDVISLRDDFSPKTYGQAISVAEKANADALIIDSASHEWEGVGGVLDMAAKKQAEGKKGPIVWQQSKIDHAKFFMLRLMQTPISLVVVCMRAKYPMEEHELTAEEASRRKNKRAGDKEWRRSGDLSPKQSDDILYEMMLHGWIDADHCYHGTKYTRDDLRAVMPSGARITVATGAALAQWAKGETIKESAALKKAIKMIHGCADLGALEQAKGKLAAVGLEGVELAQAQSEFRARHNALREAS